MAEQVIMVVGGGGREHALAWALRGEGRRVVVAPGNAGIARDFECIAPDAPGNKGLVELAQRLRASLVVIGPEQPLVDGASDALRAAGFAVLGPSQAAAEIEGSKAFMKDLCKEAGVATADYGVFTDEAAAHAFLEGKTGGWVVKADGLCAGKGVTVCESAEEAKVVASAFLGAGDEGPRFAAASSRIVIEAFLPGLELSVLGLCDGERAVLFAPARDHKQLLDGGKGPNTGGMGAVAPLGPEQGITRAFLDEVNATVFEPVLKTMAERGEPYRGILYAGLMVHEGEASVLEFNCRFGDPEAQAVLFGTDADLCALFAKVANGERFDGSEPDLVAACAPTCAVVSASRGYPEKPEKGFAIDLGASTSAGENTKVFFAGVKAEGEALLTSGGRVLACVARAESLKVAIDEAYELTEEVSFDGRQIRTDIGASTLS